MRSILASRSGVCAFWFLARNLERVIAKRRLIQSSRRVDHDYMASWFHYAPVTKQASKKMPRVMGRSEAAKT